MSYQHPKGPTYPNMGPNYHQIGPNYLQLKHHFQRYIGRYKYVGICIRHRNSGLEYIPFSWALGLSVKGGPRRSRN